MKQYLDLEENNKKLYESVIKACQKSVKDKYKFEDAEIKDLKITFDW